MLPPTEAAMSNTALYTREVGRKFNVDGSPRSFPGNTIICFIAPDSPIGLAASAFQDALREAFGSAFALLPPSSFHMTVMELLCDQVRRADRWSDQLALGAPLAATDAFFLQRVPPIPAPTGLTMRVDGLFAEENLMLTLQPIGAAAAALAGYRAAVAAATGVRFPDHDSYGFHISLAYRLHRLDAAAGAALAALCSAWEPRLIAAGATVALPPPALTFFDDMTRFVLPAERHSLPGRS
jgi:hypothetical protein